MMKGPLWRVFTRQAPPRAVAEALSGAANDADTRALYLLLLGRLPEAGAIYEANRGQPRRDLTAAILGSAEFRRRVLFPFLSQRPIPQRELDDAERRSVRAWLRQSGVRPAGAEPDQLDLLTVFLNEEPGATLFARALPEHLPALRRRLAAICTAHRESRLPLGDDDTKALYLLLLGRPPESEAVLADNRDRPRRDLIASMLGSQEFRDAVLRPFVAGEPTPHDSLLADDLDGARAWVEGFGIAVPESAADWIGVFATFVAAEPLAEMAPRLIGDEAAAFLRRAAAERGSSVELRRLRAELGALRRELEKFDAGWRQHMPAFLNAVASVAGFGREQARLSREIEALRSESGGGPPAPAAHNGAPAA